MLIVDSQIHIGKNAEMSAHHRQIPNYLVDDALAEMVDVPNYERVVSDQCVAADGARTHGP